MNTLTPSSRRWIILGCVVVLLASLLFLFRDVWTGDSRKDSSSGLSDPSTEHAMSPDEAMPGMDTRPHASADTKAATHAPATVSPERQQLIGLTTAVVDTRTLTTVIRAFGKVDYVEEHITHVNLRMTGWVEELFVHSTGQMVDKGQPLFTLYSPELVATQEEFLLALRAREDIKESPLLEVREQGDQLIEAAKDRLRLWSITDKQIEELARRGTPQTYVTIHSPARGYVVDKNVFKGMYIKPDLTAYTLADLSTVWVHAEVFEYELPYIRTGLTGIMTLDAYPDQTFEGEIIYIYPYLNPETRTVKVRLEFPNPHLRLKPDMFGTVRIDVTRGRRLAVPAEAVLDSGTRTMVYVSHGEGSFEPRDVTLGPKVGEFFEVVKGLEQGERVVTSGTFLLDSESKLTASSNKMGSLGMGGVKMEQADMGKMDMGDMQMNESGMEGMDRVNGPIQMREKKPLSTTDTSAGAPSSAVPVIKQAGGLTVSFVTDPSPPAVGDTRVIVTIMDAAGSPVSEAGVRLTYTMPMPGMTPPTIPMTEGREGRYESRINLSMAGPWHLTVTIHRPGLPVVEETFRVTAR